ncbi:MAG: type II toxin-antitoxin system VapC family toxin [Micrococcales bacterium]|nr:type II toxin-antitoxin system VapC family toxin [Micrococcales bacterium]
MSVWYIDTSAALKFVVNEPESDALARELRRERPDLVASLLLETEVRRAATHLDLPQAVATDILSTISLVELEPGTYRQAGLLPGMTLRSLDAIHLASALNLGVDAILTYDARLTQAAYLAGIPTIAPAGTAERPR